MDDTEWILGDVDERSGVVFFFGDERFVFFILMKFYYRRDMEWILGDVDERSGVVFFWGMNGLFFYLDEILL